MHEEIFSNLDSCKYPSKFGLISHLKIYFLKKTENTDLSVRWDHI